MPNYNAGQEVDAWCTRCKLDLTHKIVAAVGGKPVRVECRTCYGVHNYRPAKTALTESGLAVPKPSSAVSSSSSSPSRPRSSSGSSAAPRRTVPEAPLAPPDHAHIHLYKVTERFEPGTWIQHKTFGIGLVQRDVGGNKIEVRFDDTVRTLVHGVQP